MLLSRAGKYAIVSLLQLDKKGGVTTSAELAKLSQMPENVLQQILHCLVTHKTVIAEHGGYRLARPLSHISVLDIVEAVEGPVHRSAPGFSQLSAESEAVLEHVLDDATGHYRQVLASVTLSALTVR